MKPTKRSYRATFILDNRGKEDSIDQIIDGVKQDIVSVQGEVTGVENLGRREFIRVTDRKLTGAGIAKISSGLLPAGTLLLSSRAPVGYLAIAAMPVAINQGFIAMKCNERASNFFMLNWCQTNMAEIESRATGTTFAEISKQSFRPIPVVLPPKELMAAFSAKVAPLYAQITANLHQSRTLATLRDTLLPKLLSGELRIPSAEQAANDAA